MNKYLNLINKYNITLYNKYVNTNKVSTVGIGDVLLALIWLKNNIIDGPIFINLGMSKYFENPINAFEFRIQLINIIIKENKLNSNIIKYIYNKKYYRGIDINLINNIKNFKLKIPEVKFKNSLNEKLNNKKYIIFHTKCRFVQNYDYVNLIKKLSKFYLNYKSKYKIILLGEKKMLTHAVETKTHRITTIYKELLQLKNNNDIIDLTVDIIGHDGLDIKKFIYDMNIIKNAEYNISVGLGGHYCCSIIFGKKTINFRDIYTHLISKDIQNIYQHNNLKSYFKQLEEI
uniref:Uncharacterized protein n=1 Tax=Mimivirus LCMiAC01 TaxID=2506608 RepID=A0A481YYY9_9VIRU|nr:MAG: hypothetical protein LCMiAC01_01400 [Mimivirus LCMiAC01]